MLPSAAVGAADGVEAEALAAGDDLLQRLEGGHRAGGDLVRVRLAVKGEPGGQVLDALHALDFDGDGGDGVGHVRPAWENKRGIR